MKIALLSLQGRPRPFMLIRPTLTMLRKEISAIVTEGDKWMILDDNGLNIGDNGPHDWPPIEASASYTISISRYPTFY